MQRDFPIVRLPSSKGMYGDDWVWPSQNDQIAFSCDGSIKNEKKKL